MKSIEERLSDANPVASSTYNAASFQHLYGATMATRNEASRALWRTLQLRVAASVGAVAVLMTGAVTALGGLGSQLPVLNFAAAGTGSTEHHPAMKFAGAEAMSIRPTNYTFTGLDALSSATSSAPVYSLSAPTDLVATLQSVGQALNVAIGTPTTSTTPGVVTSQGPTTNGVSYSGEITSNSGYAAWGVSRNDTNVSPLAGTTGATGTTGANDPAASASFINNAVALAHATSPGLNFGAATVTSSAGAPDTSISVPVDLNGAPTSLEDSFTFNAQGELLSANGVAFTATVVDTYPLQSPASATSEITAQMAIVNQAYSGGGRHGGAVTWSTLFASTDDDGRERLTQAAMSVIDSLNQPLDAPRSSLSPVELHQCARCDGDRHLRRYWIDGRHWCHWTDRRHWCHWADGHYWDNWLDGPYPCGVSHDL
jgi:hypothetical protein